MQFGACPRIVRVEPGPGIDSQIADRVFDGKVMPRRRLVRIEQEITGTGAALFGKRGCFGKWF